MGNTISENEEDPHRFDGIETIGYRILGVQPNSPASQAGLVSFFDFLVGVNGELLFGIDTTTTGGGGGENGENGETSEESEYFEDVDFPALLKENIGKEIELLVWNIKSQTQRFVLLTPTNSWPGTGLLGVTIRMDDYSTAADNLLRILSVTKSSPAAIAGLKSNTDYLLGTTMVSFEHENVLARVLNENIDKVVEMYVYNTESDVVRVVTLMPTWSWGGEGLLGAQVGRGYLHRLPKSCTGTLGVSFERKVRMSGAGVAIENTTSCTTTATTNTTVQDMETSKESSYTSTEPTASSTSTTFTTTTTTKEKNELLEPSVLISNHEVLTCGISGQQAQMEPQLEYELESPPPLSTTTSDNDQKNESMITATTTESTTDTETDATTTITSTTTTTEDHPPTESKEKDGNAVTSVTSNDSLPPPPIMSSV